MEQKDIDKMHEDSDIIFTAITTGSFNNITEAKQALVTGYVPDSRFSRAGISHAMKRLEEYYHAKEEHRKKLEEGAELLKAKLMELEKEYTVKNPNSDSFHVTGWTNFCRVFELPDEKEYPKGYCFGGGIPVQMIMVDWFNPVEGVGQPGVSKEVWIEKFKNLDGMERTITMKELKESLKPFLLKKNYVKMGKKYLVLCNFGAAFTFKKVPFDE